MDSLFDENQADAGESEAFCPRCKQDTQHDVILKVEGEIKRVQCQVCSDLHPYKKAKDDENEGAGRPQKNRKPSWQEAMAQVTEQEINGCRPYSILDTYEEFDIVSHPKFGTGFVTELLADNKVEITFRDERRVLVHNRSDLAQKMPKLAEMPAPREQKKRRKKLKRGEEMAARFAEASGVKIDHDQEEAKLVAAQRAAEERRLDALRNAGASGVKLTKDQERQLKQAEKDRIAAEKAEEKQKLADKKAVEREKAAAKKLVMAERKRLAKEKENAKKAEAAEKKRQAKEKDSAKKAEAAEKKRLAKEKEAARKAEAAEKKRQAKEKDSVKKAAAAERKRLAKEKGAAKKAQKAAAKPAKAAKPVKAKATKPAAKKAAPSKSKAAKPAKKPAKVASAKAAPAKAKTKRR